MYEASKGSRCSKGCLNPTAQSFLDGIGWQGGNDVTKDWHHKCVGKDVFPLLDYHAPNFFTVLMQRKFSFTSELP